MIKFDQLGSAKNLIEYRFTEGQLDKPANPKVVGDLSVRLAVSLPIDYLAFLRLHNGGDGFLGDNYVIFWKAEELADFNREYEVERYAPGILLFGSDGGGKGYGFNVYTEGMPIVRIPFIGMDRECATFVASGIRELFATLAGKKPSV